MLNKRLLRYIEEINKVENKISSLQGTLKDLKQAQKEEENQEIIRTIRNMNLKGKNLLNYLSGLQECEITTEQLEEIRKSSEKGAELTEEENEDSSDENKEWKEEDNDQDSFGEN